MTRPMSGPCATAVTPREPAQTFPHRDDRPDPMRQDRMRPHGRRISRRESRPLFRHFRQRPGTGPRNVARPSKNFARKPSAKSSVTSWKCLIPNVNSGIAPEKLGEFINDNIIRSLAGVPESGRPVFLKIVYHGPRAMEELAQYDPNLVVGILGGSAGTTYDAFKLIHDAQKYGARAWRFSAARSTMPSTNSPSSRCCA